MTHPDTERAYVESIRYSLDVMTGFARRLTRPSLVLILGDHQPPGFRSLEGFRETTDVPLHVISNRPELLVPFEGMPDGLVPDPEFPQLRTEQLLGYRRGLRHRALRTTRRRPAPGPRDGGISGPPRAPEPR